MRYEWHPTGMRAKVAFDRLTDCAWRLRRIPKLETGLMLRNRKKRMKEANPDENTTSAEDLGEAYLRTQPGFAALSRHERQIERSYQTAYRELQCLQYARNLDCDPFYVANMKKQPGLVQEQPKREHEGYYPHTQLEPAEIQRRLSEADKPSDPVAEIYADYIPANESGYGEPQVAEPPHGYPLLGTRSSNADGMTVRATKAD